MSLKDVTKKPHATGTAQLRVGEDNIIAHQAALNDAVANFMREYNRLPEWDFVFFRGCHTTFSIVLEIWEEES